MKDTLLYFYFDTGMHAGVCCKLLAIKCYCLLACLPFLAPQRWLTLDYPRLDHALPKTVSKTRRE